MKGKQSSFHAHKQQGNAAIGILGLFTALLLISNALLAYIVLENNKHAKSYIECIAEGGDILPEIYPKTCVSTSGRVFVKVASTKDRAFTPTAIPTRQKYEKEGCVIGGCSNELCLDKTKGEAATNCVYKPIYACYRNAKCERQEDGECGWTKDSLLIACLNSYREKESGE